MMVVMATTSTVQHRKKCTLVVLESADKMVGGRDTLVSAALFPSDAPPVNQNGNPS